ncbi:hypothetical protein GCM10007981_03330 [Thermocladium modestius]|uniref:Uncharacterized protein n=1 Tax=Thermocladium modestius TaxID=62609 RepID=A0A830GW59_9CREN|nr:hypothetical protein [Thermocladium modestius]GGP19479.1 hypothetical protein GCM10007981_03330 [Thermocladium modestius]
MFKEARKLLDSLMGRKGAASIEVGTPVRLGLGDRLILGRDSAVLISNRIKELRAPAKLPLRRVDIACVSGLFIGRAEELDEWIAGGGYIAVERARRARRRAFPPGDLPAGYMVSLTACPAAIGLYAWGGRDRPLGSVLPRCLVPCDVVKSGVARYMSLSMSWSQ